MTDKDMGLAPNVTVKKSAGVGGKILALVIGFFVGVAGTVGGVIGAGYYAITRPIKEVANTVDGVAGTNGAISEALKQYLADEYYQGTVQTLLGGITGAVSEIQSGNGSFSSLNKISPAVEKAIKALAEKFYDLGAGSPHGTREEAISKLTSDLMDTPFNKLGDLFAGEGNSILNSIRLGDMLLNSGAFTYETLTADKLMMSLFYGDAEAYTLDPENKKITMNAGYEQLTVRSIREGGVTGVLENIPLDVVVGATDDMMKSLLWGPDSRYELDSNGEPKYKQVRYVLEQREGDETAKMYDDTDTAYVPTLVDGTELYTVTVKEKTQYLKRSETEANVYFAYADASAEKAVLYKKTTIADFSEPETLLNGIELGTVMNLTPTSDEFMLRLAYGEKDVDWEVKDGVIQMLNGKKATTIGDLRSDDTLNDKFNTLPIHTLMEIDNSDAMMRALAYGGAYCYTYDPAQTDKDKQIVMNQVRYTYEQKDGDDKKYLYGEDGEKADLVGAPVQVTQGSDTLLKIEAVLARDKDDETKVTSSQIRYLKLTDGYYYAWKAQECSGNENTILYPKLTLGDLRENPEGLLNEIELGSVMNLDHTSDEIMLTLAYGEKGVDWEYKRNASGEKTGLELVGKPKTIGDLRNNEDMTEVLNGLQLSSVMEIDNTDIMMRTLAYGAEYRYTYDPTQTNKDKQIVMNQVRYTYEQKDGDDKNYLYGEDGEKADLVGAPVQVTQGSDTLLKIEAVLARDKDDETKVTSSETRYLKLTGEYYYAWKVQECNGNENKILYKPTTIGDLRDDPQGLMNDIEFGALLGLTTDDYEENKMLVALAYGEKDVDWEDDGNKGFRMLNGKKPTTIGDLQNGEMTDKINDLPLDTIMAIDNSDGMLRSLAYGPSWKHTYDSTQPEGKQITMNKIEYVLAADGKLYDRGNNEVKFQAGTTFDPTASEQTAVVIVREAKEGAEEKTETYVLKKDGNTFKAYGEDGNPAEYKETTIGDLQNDPSSILNAIELGSALGVTETSPRAMIALAYGTENIDYVLDKTKPAGQQIVPLKTPRTLKDLTGDNSAEVIDGLAIGDMVEVTPASHPVLISLAYGELDDGYKVDDKGTLSTADDVIVPLKAPRTMADLKGENSKEVINSITLESALSINANSESMMRALAYGTKNVNYAINDNGTPEDTKDDFVEMSQVFYTYKQHAVTNEHMFFDCHNEKVTLVGAPALVDLGAETTEYYRYRAVIVVQVDETTTETKYLASHNHITYYEFSGDTYAEEKAVLYKKATLGSLSEDNSVLLDNITLADAMDVDYETETDQMKKALAFSKDGKTAYTLGQLRDDPAQIVDNIHLDSMMDPAPDNAMIMYLLYGKEGVHYEVKAGTDLTEEEKVHATKIGETNKYVVSQKKILAVHEIDGVLHLHDEYGDPVMVDKLDSNGEPMHDSEGNVLQEYVKVSNPTQDEIVMGVAYTYSIDGQHYHLHKANGTTIRIKMTNEDDAKKKEVQAYYVKSEILVDETTAATTWDYMYYEHNTVSDLTGGDAEIMTHLTERLTLEEVLGKDVLEGNNFLRHLTHTTITELPTAIDSLTIAEVFEEDVYKAAKSGDTVLHYYILNGTAEVPLYKSPDGKFYLTKNGEAYSNEVENPDRILTGTWKYLLLDTTTDAEAGETYTAPDEYKVTDISELIPNMTGNMQNATLLDLQNDGIVNFLKEGETVETSILGNDIVYEIPYVDGLEVKTKVIAPYTYTVNEETVNKTKIGQLTINELLDYVSEILGVL